ncbi:MAG TPA: hypothetical protein VFQ91_23975 [Bryobacteraceae bacterium]|nr:hypothetical protein [Bryobacteraceae bacterium]
MQRIFLRALGLLAFAFVPAYGQMVCAAGSPNPTNLRATGSAELAGDLVVVCRGGTPVTSGAYPTVTVSLFFNTAVTSKIVVPGVASIPPVPATTEAVLLLDNILGPDQRPCLSTVCNNTDNVFQGKLDSFNSLSFTNIPINPPGPNADRILRFKNIRLNANNLAVGASAFAFVSVTGAQVSATNNQQQTLGIVRQGISYELRSSTDTALTTPIALTACTGYNIDLAGNSAASAYSTPGGRTMLVKFNEGTGFPNAFRKRSSNTSVAEPQAMFPQDSPGYNYNTESGYSNGTFPATNGLNRIGVADSGTILRAVFTNIPAGVKVFVGTQEAATGSTVDAAGVPTTKARLTATPGSPFTALGADSALEGGLKQVPASGEVSWEVLDTDVNATESVSFVVVVAYSNTPQPAASTITTSGGFGPQSASGIATATDPTPRFQGLSSPVPMVALNACRTTLLFQFLTNQAGFDTGVSVSNTSRDTLSTSPQTGRCTATFFPTPFNATTQAQFQPLASPTLNGGEQWTFTMSGTRPNFQGYMMVSCDFQFAHGYAFISDFGSKNLAQGYQALVIPDRPRLADPMTTATAGSGEQLIH